MKCEIIRDLLPSYVGGLTSRESDRAIEEHLKDCRECRAYLDEMKQEVQKPFVQEEELQQKTARLGELNAMLDMDKKEHPILDVEPDESVEVVETKCKVLER